MASPAGSLTQFATAAFHTGRPRDGDDVQTSGRNPEERLVGQPTQSPPGLPVHVLPGADPGRREVLVNLLRELGSGWEDSPGQGLRHLPARLDGAKIKTGERNEVHRETKETGSVWRGHSLV